MAYQLYTTEGVFQDPNINAICNGIMNGLEAQFTAPTLNAAFGLTGSCAKIVQGAANMPVPVIAFVVNSTLIYDYLKANMGSYIQKIQGIIAFTDRFQVMAPRVYIEVWFKAGALNLIDSNGIFSEDINYIPNHIL